MLKDMTPAQERVLEYFVKLFLSIAAGVVVGLIYSAVAAIIYVLSGPAQFHEEGLGLLDLTKAYIGGFAVAGAIIGLLLPLGRWAVGAALIGFVAAVPALSLIAMSMWSWPFARPVIFAVVTMSAVMGPGLGLMLWRDARNGLFSPQE